MAFSLPVPVGIRSGLAREKEPVERATKARLGLPEFGTSADRSRAAAIEDSHGRKVFEAREETAA